MKSAPLLKQCFLLIVAALTATSAFANNTKTIENEEMAAIIAEGKAIAWNRSKGNCLSCHAMDGGELAGNYGPMLIHMKLRYPDKSKLRAQIWDPTVMNPTTTMPPFGRHRILTEEELDKVVEYIHSL